jgi:ribosomal-protein-alanine N-acetyltransferase
MESHVIIHRMSDEDLEQVAALESRCFSIPWTRGMLEEELSNDRALYLVAATGARIVGYAGAWLICDEGHITNIAVDSDVRRKGVGRLLLAALLEGMQGAGVTAATLEVRRGNSPAIALYSSFGFIVEGVRRGYYADNNEDALIMWSRLANAGMHDANRQGG